MLRSLLFVPADSPRKIARAESLHPDGFIFDLEDAVAADSKLEAREQLARTLANFRHADAQIFVRVNPPGTEFFTEDLNTAVHAVVDGIVLPKCEDPSEVAAAAAAIGEREKDQALPAGKTRLLLLLETAGGIVRAFELASSNPRVSALIFGAEDYCSDMGLSRTPSGEQVAYARSVIVHAAHAAGLQVLDTVYTDIKDTEGLAQETRHIQRMGFTGKLLIHPDQIEPVHSQFVPAETEIAWAQRVVDAFETARTQSSGVVVVDGKMVDEPIFRQARHILERKEESQPSQRNPVDDD